MEKGPEIRTVGDASFEEKKQAKKEIEKAFFNHFESLSPQEQEQLKKSEYLKSKEEIALISFANKETSQLMREVGLEPYDIPEKNFHIIQLRLFKKITTGDSAVATSIITKQGAFFDAQYFRNKPLIRMGHSVLHETLHLKGHLSLEVEEGEDKEVEETIYRSGVVAEASQKCEEHAHFLGLDEAIVAETTKRLLPKLLDCPELALEKKWLTSKEAKEKKKELAEAIKISEDDIFWLDKKRKGDWKWEVIPYLQQRDVLNYICVEIQKQFPDQFQNPDDVYKVFLNAHFTGKFLSSARLVEKTFGEGSFRLLGNMDVDEESGALHLESLKRTRERQIRKKQP